MPNMSSRIAHPILAGVIAILTEVMLRSAYVVPLMITRVVVTFTLLSENTVSSAIIYFLVCWVLVYYSVALC